MSKNYLPAASVLVLLLFSTSCVATIPASFQPGGIDTPGLDEHVLALAAQGSDVVVATMSGLFRKSAAGWDELPAPGIKNHKKVTSLALNKDSLFVGTMGEGLHILTDGTWEVRTSRYGGLPDDNVFAIAAEESGQGLQGENVWIGTGGGLAVLEDGAWNSYSPGKNWLWEVTGSRTGRRGDIYLTPGFNAGGPNEARKVFKSPVLAIGIGQDSVVLGGRSGRMAILRNGAFASIRLSENLDISIILVDETAIWCGTNAGLFWGGLHGVDQGRPYPGWHNGLGMSGTVFGMMDSRLLHYRLYRMGFNSAKVLAVDRDQSTGLWALFTEKGARDQVKLLTTVRSKDTGVTEPVPGIRRYVNIDEYIKTGEKPYYETYGKGFGISGSPTALTIDPVSGGVWLGSTKSLVGLSDPDLEP